MFINYIWVQALTLTILTCFEGTILNSKQRIDFLFLFDEVHWKYFLIPVCSGHAKLIWFLQQYLDNILIISDDQDCKTWCISDTRAGYFLSNFTFRLTGHFICFSVIYVTGQDEFDSRKDTVSLLTWSLGQNFWEWMHKDMLLFSIITFEGKLSNKSCK